jgi:hypothetical protein
LQEVSMSNLSDLSRPAGDKGPLQAIRKFFRRPETYPTALSRRRDAAAIARADAREVWPPHLADPFPGMNEGTPEIGREQLSGAMLGGAILNHGLLLVRGAVDPAGVRRLTGVLERAFEDAKGYQQEDSQRALGRYFVPFPLDADSEMTASDREFVIQGAGVWTADSPPAMDVLIEELRRARVVQAIEDYLGEPAYLSVGKSTLRRVPPTSGAGWHQDGAFLGANIRTVNCWLALTDCGDDSPGLDVYPGRLNEIVPTGTHDAPFPWAVGDAVVDALPRRWISPRFKAGDALFFDQLMLHRTGVRPGMSRDRLAIESWLFAGSTFPVRQIPLAL